MISSIFVSVLVILYLFSLNLGYSERSILDNAITLLALVSYLGFSLSLLVTSFEEESTGLFNVSALHLFLYLVTIYYIYVVINIGNVLSLLVAGIILLGISYKLKNEKKILVKYYNKIYK